MMKVRGVFGVARPALVALAAVMVLALAGCLLTSEAMDRSGMVVFGSLTVEDDRGVFPVPQATQQRHYRGLRFVASSYPVSVSRVVLVYVGGQEESYTVNWRFTDRVLSHDLRVRGDRAVREVRIFQSRTGRPSDSQGRSKWKGRGVDDDEGGRGYAGMVSFTVYGLP